jgi:cbb3-type cytochrome c oxidase subunit III
MQRALMICLVLLLGPYLDEVTLNGRSQPKTSRPAVPDKKTREIRALFKQHCAKCHGKDGRGQTAEGEITGAQDFTDPDWQSTVEEQRMINSITHGRGQMPAFEKKLSKEQIKSLAAFVFTFKD